MVVVVVVVLFVVFFVVITLVISCWWCHFCCCHDWLFLNPEHCGKSVEGVANMPTVAARLKSMTQIAHPFALCCFTAQHYQQAAAISFNATGC